MTRRSKKRSGKPEWRYVIFGAVMLVALGLGLLATYVAGWRLGHESTLSSALASQVTIEQAKKDITAAYLTSSTKDCTNPTTHQAYDGAAYFAKYLQVNAYANRAVIRPCNSGGVLLAKLQGGWAVTNVNLNLDARANPVWSAACYSSDILTPDTVVRPENASIDADNLKLCKALQRNEILSIKDL